MNVLLLTAFMDFMMNVKTTLGTSGEDVKLHSKRVEKWKNTLETSVALGKRRFNIKLWKAFTDCFNCLPVAAVIDEKILCKITLETS
jgi:hypothetical protein